MQAGKMMYILSFVKKEKVQLDSGAVEYNEKEVYKCRAAKLKSTGTTEEVAHEITNTNIITLQARYNKLISRDCLVFLMGEIYEILFLDVDIRNNTVLLKLNLKDK